MAKRTGGKRKNGESAQKRVTRARVSLDGETDPPEDDGTDPANSSEEEDNDNDGRLREENRELKARLKAAEEQLQKVINDQTAEEKRLHSQGKARYARRTLGGSDAAAQQVVNTYWDLVIKHHKTFEEHHKEYSEDPATPCGIVMSKIIPPDGVTKKEYWDKSVVHAMLYKKQQLNSKMLRKQQHGHHGKPIVCLLISLRCLY